MLSIWGMSVTWTLGFIHEILDHCPGDTQLAFGSTSILFVFSWPSDRAGVVQKRVLMADEHE